MTETVREGDIGRTFIIGSGGYDLSGETELRVVFLKPDGTTTVEKLTADGVSAPAVAWTGLVDGVSTTFDANEYWSYPSESGLLTPTGDWTVHGEYVDGTPKDLSGDVNAFTVLARE
jgi:hypothetical protein